ncbi:MAG TPA: BatD family protein [Candidatus Hydrogenedentes bacterium]|nr:BatD family protein [Candidatus Hydrogenedentota bacterium]
MRRVAIVIMVLLAGAAGAAEPEVRASVDRNTVTVRRPFLLTVQVTGNEVGEITIPDVDGLHINKRADQTGSQMQVEFSGGRSIVARTQTFGYYAQAIRPGRYTIPPIQVQVDGKTLATQPILINVLETGAASQTQQEAVSSTRPGRSEPEPQRGDQPTWEDAVFIESTVDKHEVFQGEPIRLTLSLWCLDMNGLQVSSYSGGNIKYPDSDGFYAVTLEPQRVSKTRGNWNYTVTEFRQVLYPTATGDLVIGAWHWEGAGMYGFQRQHFALDTQPMDIKVKPLPDRPPDFSGAVGTFTIKAQLERDQAMQGVPIKLTVRIAGRGNPDAIGAPRMPKIENVYISDPEKQSQEIQSPSGPAVEKTFSYTITPLEPGTLEIPAISYCYFDATEGAYKTEQTAPFTVTVLKSVESSQPRTLVTEHAPTEKGKVEVIGEDILPIVTNPGPLRPYRPSPINTGAALICPVAACGVVAAYTRRRRRFEQDTGLARSHGAKARFLKHLKTIGQSPEPSDELYRALIGYIADKFNRVESGMTSDDVRQIYESHGIGSDDTGQVVKILRACERARYAGGKLSGPEVQALADAAVQAIERLDEALKKDRRP